MHVIKKSWLINFWRIPVILAVAVTILDQVTKHYVVKNRLLYSSHVVVPHFFNLVHWRNTGGAWGILSGHPYLLGIISVFALALLVFFFTLFVENHPERAISLALVLGGTAGNFLDRIFRGNVVDFLHFYYRSFDWLPAFNVADSAISIGVALFIFSSLYHGNKQTPTPSNS